MDNNIIEKFLPIGSVVILKNATKKIMVTGFCPVDGDNQLYDYSGCMYPDGIMSNDETLLFNHDQIDIIYFLGFRGEEEKVFQEKLKEILEEAKK